MPKRQDIDAITIIGAGPIVIGQACEFDYSGTQACKALRAEGYRTVLVNSNPATIMTDPATADTTYIEPITPAVVEEILRKERERFPNERMALLPTMGGQTGLNTGLALDRQGILAELGVEMIGARADVIDRAEDRQRFREAMTRIGLESPKSQQVTNLSDAHRALQEIGGLPAIIRPSFTLGGAGGGIAYNLNEFETIVTGGLEASPANSVLIEESVLGWKEYEMEVVRDRQDNCIIICSIENIDPMGVHTGDSITVAPALTLTDREYQVMRNASIAVLREIGVETGGSNVQFAINPQTGRLVVIEMNPRVSRSSALASKATGFPIAKVAARLAVGYHLDELANDITRVTPASFEPTIDYIVTKIPRFAFEKFKGASPNLTTSMKSVGEVMAMGRSFKESMQKALRSMETGLTGFDPVRLPNDREGAEACIAKPVPERILYIAEALRQGWPIDEVARLSHIDPWFLREIAELVEEENRLLEQAKKDKTLPTAADLSRLKAMGFSDDRLAELCGVGPDVIEAARLESGINTRFLRVDSCAGEFPSFTPYLYATYDTAPLASDVVAPIPDCEAEITAQKKVIILGGGPNRIGQGIEFDYACVHAAYALKEIGIEAIMVNCNPETVSTDYDTANRLYFEPLTTENVLEICRLEMSKGELLGVIVQFGGQTPLKLANALEKAGVPILGTSPDAIDLAEDRERFQALIQDLGLLQPPNGLARSRQEALNIADEIGYPVVIRPSYVLGGRAMEIVHDASALENYIETAVQVSGQNPVLIDYYLTDAVEVDVDALCDQESVYVAGIMEHIEEAGIHSGDSACALPPHSLSASQIKTLADQTRVLAHALGVKGLMNVQFALKGDHIYILEVNPRASRTVPFVAKATGVPLAALATKVMAGVPLSDFQLTECLQPDHTAVKEAVFPFNRFPGVDVLLGPEMKSTGEVMGIDSNFQRAFAKAQLGAGVRLPTSSGRDGDESVNPQKMVFISLKDSDKGKIVEAAQLLVDQGLRLCATSGTANFLKEKNIPVTTINKVRQGRPHIVDAIINGEISLILNTTADKQAVEDSFSLRRMALQYSVPYYTTLAGAIAAAEAIKAMAGESRLPVRSLQSYG